jgi:cobalt transporter subunit CbtB
MSNSSISSLSLISTQERLAAGAIALLLGTFMLAGIGFTNSEVVHNTAHDTRHALTFPCH